VRALIVVLWRGGRRVQEALALGERDLDPRRGSLHVRRGKGGRRREIGTKSTSRVSAHHESGGRARVRRWLPVSRAAAGVVRSWILFGRSYLRWG